MITAAVAQMADTLLAGALFGKYAIAAVAVVAIAAGIFFTYNTPEKDQGIAQTEQLAATEAKQEALETIATDYYSEELAMMDYYQYLEY